MCVCIFIVYGMVYIQLGITGIHIYYTFYTFIQINIKTKMNKGQQQQNSEYIKYSILLVYTRKKKNSG